jgi:type VI secretion system protein ImpA
MAAQTFLDIDALLAPIPGENPAGVPLPFTARERLEEARKEDNPEDYAEDDPRRPKMPKNADWRGIVKVGSDVLRNTSKDLLVATRMTEALLKEYGFGGLRDGLRLLRRLCAEAGDRLYPVLTTEDDKDVRAASFFWLDDPDRGARFPAAIRMVPLVFNEAGEGYGWQHWRQAQETNRKPSPNAEQFEKAILITPWLQCQQQADELHQCREELAHLVQVLEAQLGNSAPGLTGLSRAVTECELLVQQILQRKGGPSAEELAAAPPEAAAGPEAAAPAAADGEAAPGAGGLVVAAPAPTGLPTAGAQSAPKARAEIYKHLRQAADLLQQLEPHSPVPYLIQRAIALGALPFPKLMKALVREAGVLEEMSRELGISELVEPEE